MIGCKNVAKSNNIFLSPPPPFNLLSYSVASFFSKFIPKYSALRGVNDHKCTLRPVPSFPLQYYSNLMTFQRQKMVFFDQMQIFSLKHHQIPIGFANRNIWYFHNTTFIQRTLSVPETTEYHLVTTYLNCFEKHLFFWMASLKAFFWYQQSIL